MGRYNPAPRMSSNFAASFAPNSDVNARSLVLGSIPGRESLKAERYYAHPCNQFWKIMATWLGFAAFFQSHTAILEVFFNGATAQATYYKHVLPGLPALPLYYTRLPSTSPAHAALSFGQKLDAWKCILD